MKIPIKSIKSNRQNNLSKKTEAKEVLNKEVELPKKAPKHPDKSGATGRVELWEKIAKFSIYLLVFLVPLFFLPWTFNILDFNKQALAGILVFIVLLFWILKILTSGKLEINYTIFNLPVVILVFVYGLATIFSLWPYGSFWGWPLNISAGFLTLLYLVLLYFLIVNILTKKEEIFWLLFVLVLSGFLAAVFSGFQLFGKFLLPWDFAKITSFNTVGTLNSLALFLAVLLPLAISLVFISRKLMRWLLAVFALVMVVELVLINFWAGWAVLIAGLSVFFVFEMLNIKRAKQGYWLSFPMAILIIALFFLTFRISLAGFLPPRPIEIYPSQRAEVSIAKNVLLKTSLLAPFFGTGPGTFVFNYSKFKPIEMNQTIFWDIRFDNGASEILDKLITTGILGILSLFALFGMFFWLGFRYLTLVRSHIFRGAEEKAGDLKDDTSWLLGLGVFSSFTGVVIGQFLYPANFSLTLVFWLILAGLTSLSLEEKKIKSWTLEPSFPLTVGISFILVLVLILGVGFLFVGTQKYIAEIKYLAGLKAWQESQTEQDPSKRDILIGQAINNLEKAINLNPRLDSYWRDVSQLYLIRLNETLQQRALASQEMQNLSQLLISNAITSAIRATDISPENVANWNVRGFIYRNLIGLVGGADDWGLKSYQKAVELEPTNPYIFTEIGRIYILKSDLLAQQGKEAEKKENLRLALENFEKARGLKDDYAPAHFQIAVVYHREGKTQEAIEKLEAIKQAAPFDIGLAFQLGLLYYNNNQFDEAKLELERAVRLDENYSNARYFLGLVYDREGNKKEAISQFERIEKLNPDNQEVKEILVNLRAGKPALEGIQPAQPPIEEKPPERLEK